MTYIWTTFYDKSIRYRKHFKQKREIKENKLVVFVMLLNMLE